MAKRILFLLIGIGLSSPVAAATPADRIHADVAYLASDALEGRAAGSAGHALAATYVERQLRAAGLQPAGEHGGFIQSVPLRRATLVPGSTVARIGEGGRWQPLGRESLRVAPSLSRAALDLSAGTLFVGFGIDEPTLATSDYAGLDARGKIVIAFAGAPPGLGSEIAAFVKSQKAAYAAAHGAVGYIEIPSWPIAGGAGDLGRDLALPVNGWAGQGEAGPSPDLAQLTISSRLAERMFAGAPTSLADLRRDALAGHRPAGFALRPTLSVAAHSSWIDSTSAQLFARVPGKDPTLMMQSIMLVAHLDHLGRVAPDRPGGDAIDNGALDNAAGVAILVEAARRLTVERPGSRRSIVLLISTGEELGDVGSDYAVSHWPHAAGKPVAAIDLDMPLLLYHATDIAAPGGEHGAIGEALAAAGQLLGLTLSPDPMPQQELVTRSDHLRFLERGVPAALVVTGYANGGEAAWADFLAHRYHQPSDDLAQPIRWNEAARLALLIAGAARRLADQPALPAWNQGEFFAKRTARLAIRPAKD